MIVDQLIEQATERAGFTDFGPEGWRQPLEVLVDSMNTEAQLNELGEIVTSSRLVEHLVVRLQIEQCFTENPEIAEQVVERPVFGLGLPRTGSSALGQLLALDDEHRTLRTWEGGNPVPPPETATQHTDPRIEVAAGEVAMITELFPDFADMVPSAATGPVECLLLMALNFESQMFEATAKIPSYSEYLAAADLTATYTYHRRVLQLLQWKCPPNNWWLKSPAHMQHVTELSAVYPDAEFILTHRDITKVIPSVCALMTSFSSPLTDSPDPVYFGRLTSGQWETSMHRLLDFRDAGNEHRFHDVQFAEVQSDPVGAVRKLYAGLGIELRSETAELMDQWWQENSRDRAGSRKYIPEEYGLDLDDISKRFAFYSDRFITNDGR